MRIALIGLLIIISSNAYCSEDIVLPAEGLASAESIKKCEAQVSKAKGFQKKEDQNGIGYAQVNPGSDSFVYFFTGQNEPAHPAMLKVTVHPMADPFHPQQNEIDFFEAHASKKEIFIAWRKRVLFDFGRGFANGVYEASKKSSAKVEKIK